MKADTRIQALLESPPEPPSERHTKEEILEWCQEQAVLLAEVRRVLINLMANSLLIIGEK